jgi:hypothetical protein
MRHQHGADMVITVNPCTWVRVALVVVGGGDLAQISPSSIYVINHHG